MGEPKQEGLASPARLILANETSFELGDLKASPAHRQLEWRGRCETLEPRVMQVFVALARPSGRIVSRDELIERCWDSRIVGDDSINRTLSRLRHALSNLDAGCFAVETITKVGYRLTGDGCNAQAQQRAFDLSAPDVPTSRYSRRAFAGTLIGTSLVAAGALTWRLWPEHRGPPNAAMQFYLQAIQNRGQNSLQQAEQSVAYLREATRIDPEFTQAWGALAWAYRALLEYGPRPDSSRIATLARSAAARALEVEPNNVDARAALLLLQPIYGRWAEVLGGCRSLLTQHPHNSILLYNLGHTYCETGRWRAAIPALTELGKREPFWPLPRFWLFQALLASGRLEEAEALLAEAFTRWPDRLEFWLATHFNLLASNRSAEALAFAVDLSKRPTGSEQIAQVALAVGKAIGDRSGPARELAVVKLQQQVKSDAGWLTYAVTASSLIGAVDFTVELLEGYYFGEGAWAAVRSQRPRTGLLFSAWTKSLRNSPSFPALVSRTGLEQYWSKSGLTPDYKLHA